MPEDHNRNAGSPAAGKAGAAASGISASIRPLRAYALRALIAVGLAAAAFILWQIRFALLLIFASVIVATVLVAAGTPFRRWARMPLRPSIAAGGGLILLGLVGFAWLAWPQIHAQTSQLVEQLPSSVQELESRIGGLPAPLDQVSPSTLLSDATTFLTSWTTTFFEVAAQMLFVTIAGVFLAAAPDRYRAGFLALFPQRQRNEVAHDLDLVGHALRRWLLARLLSMAIVGATIATGTWAIGLPSPLALGVVAGAAEFVPFLGPVAGAVPALLLSAGEGLHAMLWTVLLFLAVQQLESNVIAPLVDQELVHIPAAVLLLAMAAFAALFGVMGVLLGAPLAVVAYTLVKEVYARRLHAGHDAGPQAPD